MRIALASDHAGFRLKGTLARFLAASGHEVVDFGAPSEAQVDYPDFIRPAAEAVARGACDRAVVLGGSGNGEAMAANRVLGVRCALCWDSESARLASAHNDANVISMGARLISEEEALAIVTVWLTTAFEGGRHLQRIIKLDAACGGEAPTASASWRRLDIAGHDCARLFSSTAGHELTGTAVFTEAGVPARLDYRIACDPGWLTSRAAITGWVGDRPVCLMITADAQRRWRVNGDEVSAVFGCHDVDLGFTPATNLIALRRLALATGDAADVRAAWLDAPAFALAPLPQRYERTGKTSYAYEGGGLTLSLEVAQTGFITRYPGLWEAA